MAREKNCYEKVFDWLQKSKNPEFDYMRELSKKELASLEKTLRGLQAKAERVLPPSATPENQAEFIAKEYIERVKLYSRNAKRNAQRHVIAKAKVDDALKMHNYSSQLMRKYYFQGIGHEIDLDTGYGKGTKQDISTDAASIVSMNFNALEKDLQKENGIPMLRSQETSGEVMEQARTQQYTDDSTGRVARAIYNHAQRILKMLRISGADVSELEGRVTGQFHDLGKLLNPKSEKWTKITKNHDAKMEMAAKLWANFTRPLLDLVRSFPEIDVNDSEAVDKALKETYSTLINRRISHVIDKEGGEAKPMYSKSSLANTIGSKERKLFFKDGHGSVSYQQEYGAGTLLETILQDGTKAGFKIALINRFGPNAEENFKYMASELVKHNPIDSKVTKDIADMQKMFDYSAGRMNDTGNGRVGTIFKNIMAFNNVVKLGMVTTRVFQDLGNQYSTMRAFGLTMQDSVNTTLNSIKQMGRALGEDIPGYTRTETRLRKEEHSILDLCNVVSKQLIGTTNAFGQDIGSLTGMISKMNDIQFKVNLLKYWDQGLDHGTQVALSRHLSNYSNDDFKNLPHNTQKIMTAYDFSPEEWEVWRKHPTEIEGSGKFTTPSDWKKVSDEDITKLTGAKGASNIAQERLKLEIKATSFFHDQYKYIVPNFNFAHKSKLAHLISSSEWGYALKSVFQYKSYSVGFGERVLGRAIKGSDTKGEMMRSLSQIIASTAFFGYMSIASNSILHGKGLPDLSGPEGKAKMAEGMLAAAGFWGDTMAAFSKPMTTFEDMFLGPVVGDAHSAVQYLHTMYGHAVNSFFDQRRSYRKSGLEVTEQFAKRNTPFLNNWLFTGIMNNFVDPPDEKRT